jgi:uncharacterized protein YndB with AHSA1/START domain
MTPESPRRPAVHLQRVIPAPAEQVYRAWLEPELLRQWLAPGDLEATRIEVDERVGGSFRVWQGSGDQDAGGFEGQILELVPDRRIVLRWGFVGPARMDGPSFDSLLTITLSDVSETSTTLTLVHEELDTLWEAMPQVAENVKRGWELVLDKLATVADGAPAR